MKTQICILVAILSATLSFGQTTVQEWQAKALKAFPDLGVKGSALNVSFIDHYNERKQSDPDFFKNPAWPFILTKQIVDSSPANIPELEPPSIESANPEKTDASGKTPNAHKLVLREKWDGKVSMSAGGGSATMDDLKRLLTGHGKPSVELSGSENAPLFGGVTYLMPLAEAKAALKVTRQLASKTKVACAGFPDGLFYYSVDGQFDGHYNRLYFVTDVADQVACIHLVDEAPKTSSVEAKNLKWHTYNFVNARVKSKRTLLIGHEVTKTTDGISVDSELYDPEKGKVLELSRWFAPQPVIAAILHCVNQ